MPANLPPQYNKAEEEFRKAGTPAERLEKLREMFRLLPKHKGTEKLQSDLKQRISRTAGRDRRARRPGARRPASATGSRTRGAGRSSWSGPPNAGKSALLAALTNAQPEVAAYPFTTRGPSPGIMPWEDVPVQLVDLPPISARVLRALGAEPDPLGRRRPARGRPRRRRRGRGARGGPDAAGRGRTPSSSATLPYDVEDEAIQHVKTLLVANKTDAEGADGPARGDPRVVLSPGSRSCRSRWNGARAGRPASDHVRSIGSPAGLYQSPWQAGRSVEALHGARSAARCSTWPGRSIATSSTR